MENIIEEKSTRIYSIATKYISFLSIVLSSMSTLYFQNVLEGCVSGCMCADHPFVNVR